MPNGPGGDQVGEWVLRRAAAVGRLGEVCRETHSGQEEGAARLRGAGARVRGACDVLVLQRVLACADPRLMREGTLRLFGGTASVGWCGEQTWGREMRRAYVRAAWHVRALK